MPSASSGSKRCTTTCTTSSGGGASTPTSSTSPRSAHSGRSSSRGAAEVGRLPGRRRAVRHATSPSARAAAPGASCASTPTASARSSSRSRTSSARSRCSRSAAARRSPTSSASRTTAARCAMFSITTPFGDTTFRFVERRGYRALFPGVRAARRGRRGGENRFGFQRIDHVTSNFQTMKPALLWLEHVLGFEQLLGDRVPHQRRRAATARRTARACKSVVMWDPAVGREVRQQRAVRGRSSRPRRSTSSTRSTAATACSTSALTVADIVTAVRGLRAARRRVHADAGHLLRHAAGAPRRQLGIGADRRGHRRAARARDPRRRRRATTRYLLQIFLKEAAGLYDDPEAGPFFFEIIQRKGDRGLRRRQLPRAVREHRARAAAAGRR